MNYQVKNKSDNQIENDSSSLSIWQHRLNNLNWFMVYTLSKPIDILDKLTDIVAAFINGNPMICGCCLCATITTTVSAASIAIGVGVGVGIGCQQVEIIFNNYTNSSI